MATRKRGDVLAELKKLEQGLTKYQASFSATIDGERLTGAQAVAFAQRAVGFAQAVATARSELKVMIANEKAFLRGEGKKLNALRTIVGVMYASDSTTLAEFGLTPPKPRTPMTNEVLLLRAEKARATREKRGTLGKRQKAKITGNVSGVVITPITRARDDAPPGGEGSTGGDGTPAA